MAEPEVSAEELERKLRWGEEALEELGAEPLDINRKNRALLDQRVTYRYRQAYYRMDHAVFEHKPFLILSTIENPDYAAIGLMEDVDAIPLSAGREEIREEIRRTVLAEESPETKTKE